MKNNSSMNKTGSLSLVQGPSAVTCMIATYPFQLIQQLHQIPRVGIGQCDHQPTSRVSVSSPEATGRLSHDTG
jgi:hypothetical protein